MSGTSTKPKRPRAKRGEGTQPPTTYVVLRMFELPDVLAKALGNDVVGWVALGVGVSKTEKGAIDSVIANVDEGAMEVLGRSGLYKAVALRSWKGGEEKYEQITLLSRPIKDSDACG